MSERVVANKFMISARGTGDGSVAIQPVLPIPWPLNGEDALVLAAWLVAMAEPFARTEFSELLEAVQNS